MNDESTSAMSESVDLHEWDIVRLRCKRCGMTHEMMVALVDECDRPDAAFDCVEGRFTDFPEIRVVRV